MVKKVRAAAAAEHASVSVLERPVRPSDDEVAELAYSYWESRGFQGGSPEEDWLRAERELMLVKDIKRGD